MSFRTVVAVGCDHAGFPYKALTIETLKNNGFEVLDFGCNSPDSTDYPDHVHPLAEAITSGKAAKGIVICGSGNGVAITANKHKGIRAAICWLPELASLARQHNDANVLAVPARFVTASAAKEIIQTFLDTNFEGGRHANRVNKIECS